MKSLKRIRLEKIFGAYRRTGWIDRWPGIVYKVSPTVFGIPICDSGTILKTGQVAEEKHVTVFWSRTNGTYQRAIAAVSSWTYSVITDNFMLVLCVEEGAVTYGWWRHYNVVKVTIGRSIEAENIRFWNMSRLDMLHIRVKRHVDLRLRWFIDGEISLHQYIGTDWLNKNRKHGLSGLK